MPRTKKRITISKKAIARTRATKTQEKKPLFKWGESYTSVLLGFVVIVVAVLFIGSLIKVKNIQETSSISTVPLPSQTQLHAEGIKIPETYTVKSGDSLWTISESVYKSGYNWVDVAKANNLNNPDQITEGMVLKLPKITPKPSTISPTPEVSQMGKEIKENIYTVSKGDSLWNIAVRAYADGYRWVDIAKANNLENPDLIFSGNTLKIPR